ncbi:hypothetical protein TD95_001497 [Thielaviopsis punctulata]|uniref:Zn(2)-C6 fungal-type domain-containing protein n=1 Tax=Thielaviopsis punctulata TaxID=72032 RepID=A0A0F4ZH05_9PEZI|nr:hypothetical protein TD95_001497 [Thielaviopsis punctulata]
MSSKRKPQDVDPIADSDPATTVGLASTVASNVPVKRQRVSRACDQCRSAREKCDGVQPKCFSCVFMNRQCTYNVAPKKRGVQTGLIRTLESALVWVFDQFPGSEAALNELLAQDTGRRTLLAQGQENDAGNKLHRRWRKSRTHREIDRLLSGKDDISSQPDGVDESESGADVASVARNGKTDPESQTQRCELDGLQVSTGKDELHAVRSYKLPANAPRLLDIFFSYTHCWLPIIDKSRVLALSTAFSGKDTEVKDLELWCALAVACFQDPTHQATPSSGLIYDTARSLLPVFGELDGSKDADAAASSSTETRVDDANVDEEERSIRSANGLLLLSLVSFGRDSASTASLLVGLAVRIMLRLHGVDRPVMTPTVSSSPILRKARTTMACFVLDTLISLRLGQPAHMVPEMLETMYPLPEDGHEEWDTWKPLDGFSSLPDTGSRDDNLLPSQALSSFNQLCRFFQIIGQAQLHNRGSSSGMSTPSQAANLATALDSRFSFCNSILGATTPFLPTALLLQTSFLSITLTLLPDSRLSLLWTLMESIEHAWQRLGPGTNPMLVTYMSMAGRRAKGLTGEDKEHWDRLLTKLKKPWQAQKLALRSGLTRSPDKVPLDADTMILGSLRAASVAAQARQRTPLQGGQAQSGQQAQNPYAVLMTPPELYNPPPQQSSSAPTFVPTHMQHRSSVGTASRGRTLSFTPSTSSAAGTASLHHGSFSGSLVSPLVSHVPPYLMFHGQDSNGGGNNATGRGGQTAPIQTSTAVEASGPGESMVDHDAILDELASIDCTDGMDSDAQFMANLGFAPGSDFTDMRGEFGSL